MNRFSVVRKRAKKIVEKYGLEPPVDINIVFSEMGISIEEEKNQYGIEAYSYLNDKIRIVVNTEVVYPPRRKFTLAHELGHICIPWHNGDTKCIAGEKYVQINGKRQ